MYIDIINEHRILANSNSGCVGCPSFGRGKISSLMGDVAKGIKSFKKGMSDNPDQSSSKSSSEESSSEDQNSEKK